MCATYCLAVEWSHPTFVFRSLCLCVWHNLFFFFRRSPLQFDIYSRDFALATIISAIKLGPHSHMSVPTLYRSIKLFLSKRCCSPVQLYNWMQLSTTMIWDIFTISRRNVLWFLCLRTCSQALIILSLSLSLLLQQTARIWLTKLKLHSNCKNQHVPIRNVS